MPSPESDHNFFVNSSPRTSLSAGLSGEIETLLDQASRVTNLSPAHEAIVLSDSSAFFASLKRYLELISQRSQDLRDSQITIYDKVLLELTQNGSHVDNPQSIAFFCEEFLGLPVSVPEHQNFEPLSSATEPDTSTTQGHTLPETHRGSAVAFGDRTVSPGTDLALAHGSAQRQPTELAILAQQIDPPTARLWSIYEAAKSDFFAMADPNTLEKQNAAKYLRDTAENALHHLRHKVADMKLVHELQSSFEMAKAAATALHGGKKRKFDHPSPGNAIQYGLLPRSSRVHSFRNGVANDYRPFEVYAGSSTRTSRAPVIQRGNKRDREAKSRVPRSKNRGVTSGMGEQPGRGHSGIPYGYSDDRPVDSYTPGRR